jgi:alkylhydroperoxidase/carboxymuconolactone decarboxylase family protein YurZ
LSNRLNRKKVNELRRQAFNGDVRSKVELEVVILRLCDSWLRKESESRRLNKETRELIDTYEGVLNRRQELLKTLLYEALRKLEEGLPEESSGTAVGCLSVAATRTYDNLLKQIKEQL